MKWVQFQSLRCRIASEHQNKDVCYMSGDVSALAGDLGYVVLKDRLVSTLWNSFFGTGTGCHDIHQNDTQWTSVVAFCFLISVIMLNVVAFWQNELECFFSKYWAVLPNLWMASIISLPIEMYSLHHYGSFKILVSVNIIYWQKHSSLSCRSVNERILLQNCLQDEGSDPKIFRFQISEKLKERWAQVNSYGTGCGCNLGGWVYFCYCVNKHWSYCPLPSDYLKTWVAQSFSLFIFDCKKFKKQYFSSYPFLLFIQ